MATVQGANDPDVVKICIRQNDIGFAQVYPIVDSHTRCVLFESAITLDVLRCCIQAHKLANAIANSTHLLSIDMRYNKIGDTYLAPSNLMRMLDPGDHSCKLIADAIRVN